MWARIGRRCFPPTTRGRRLAVPLETRLAHEDPERPDAGNSNDRLAAEDAAMRAEEGPSS
jgi:hypothetical protein